MAEHASSEAPSLLKLLYTEEFGCSPNEMTDEKRAELNEISQAMEGLYRLGIRNNFCGSGMELAQQAYDKQARKETLEPEESRYLKAAATNLEKGNSGKKGTRVAIAGNQAGHTERKNECRSKLRNKFRRRQEAKQESPPLPSEKDAPEPRRKMTFREKQEAREKAKKEAAELDTLANELSNIGK